MKPICLFAQCRGKMLLLLVLLFNVVTLSFSSPTELTGFTVKGNVKDEKGEPMFDVNVVEKGTTNGAKTDFDGNFTIVVPDENAILVFSYIGYASQTIEVKGRSQISIKMEPNVEVMKDVVVTALGIKRDKKALGYKVDDLKGEEVNRVKDVNFVNSLQGKSAGVRINKTSGSPDASTRVVVRGEASFGNNNALYVIDGVIVDNSGFGSVESDSENKRGFEKGDAVSDINPEDIESISILKGPNASALYGARGQNGVIVITTKKGSKQKGIGVSVNSNTTFDFVNIQEKLQNEYGSNLKLDNKTKTYFYDGATEGSWGPKYDGRIFKQYNGKMTTYESQPNNYKDFYQTGITSTNTISFEGGNDAASFRMSATDMRNRAIYPNATLSKQMVSFRGTTKLTEKLSVDGKVNYSQHLAKNRMWQDDGHSVMRNIIHMPRNISLAELKEYEKANGTESNWKETGQRMTNPYWNAYNNYNEDQRNHFSGTMQLDYKPLDWLSMMGRLGTESWTYTDMVRIAPGSLMEGRLKMLTENMRYARGYSADYIISAEKQLNENIHGTARLGTYASWGKEQDLVDKVLYSAVPGFYSVNAVTGDPAEVSRRTYESGSNSVYLFVGADYKNWLFLEGTARNDWWSTLPIENNSKLYPSVTGSFLFSDCFQLDKKYTWFSFGKVRASWAMVGNATSPYKLLTTYGLGTLYNNSIPTMSRSEQLANYKLKPEKTTATELGADLRFLNSRVGVDVTWYNKNTVNQIAFPYNAPSSGFITRVINAGEINNNGVEIQLTGSPIDQKDGLKWDVIVNWGKNKNKVVYLGPDNTRQSLGEQWNLSINANVGNPFGDIMGYGIMRDANGNKLVNGKGEYVRDPELKILGNFQPDWTGGIQNVFKYKKVTMSFHIDIRWGGDIFSATNMYGMEKGTFEESLEGREEWDASEAQRVKLGAKANAWNATGGLQPEGVYAQGTIIKKYNYDGAGKLLSVEDVDVSGQNVSQYISPESYYKQFATWGSEIHEPYIYDATYIKFRELYLGYSLPENITSKIGKAVKIEVAAVGRNLFILYKKTPNIDPEASINASNAQGFEYASFPPTRNIGFNIKMTF